MSISHRETHRGIYIKRLTLANNNLRNGDKLYKGHFIEMWTLQVIVALHQWQIRDILLSTALIKSVS